MELKYHEMSCPPPLRVTALDEFHAGRMMEVGDILASRLRMLTVGIEKGTWRAARHFLVYHTDPLALVSDEMMDDVLAIEDLEQKREKRIAAARGQAPRGAQR